MNNQQIFKLIFNHDQRLNELDNSSETEPTSALADFMKPDPTYSRLFFTASDLENEIFGINTLSEYSSFLNALESGFKTDEYHTSQYKFNDLESALSAIKIGEAVVLNNDNSLNITTLHRSKADYTSALKNALENNCIVIYKEEAPDGFNLHLFTKKNIYPDLFYPLQSLLPNAFRFFSINGKKFRTERHFYFETWTLDRPPHGFEEVFVETVL